MPAATQAPAEPSLPPAEQSLPAPTQAASETPLPMPTQTLASGLAPAPTQTNTPSVVGILGFPPGVNQLTGQHALEPERLERRPVMVKVSNYPRTGRPHAGLSAADLVFEYYIGEEANRFVGVYYSQDSPKVGPMRSGRLVDAQLARIYGGVLAYGNADPVVDEVLVKELGERAVSFDDSPCPPVCGQDTHSVTGVYVDTAEMTKFATRLGVENARMDLSGMLFDSTVPQGSDFAMRVGVEYSIRDRGEWHYDPESGLYLRWIESWLDGKTFPQIPMTDRLTGEQLAFANVIIVFAEYTEYAPTLHDINLWDNIHGERAVFFRDGIIIDGSWRSAGHDRPLQFFNQFGLPMPLKPGKTWIVFTGLSSSFESTGPGLWEMYFNLP